MANYQNSWFLDWLIKYIFFEAFVHNFTLNITKLYCPVLSCTQTQTAMLTR